MLRMQEPHSTWEIRMRSKFIHRFVCLFLVYLAYSFWWGLIYSKLVCIWPMTHFDCMCICYSECLWQMIRLIIIKLLFFKKRIILCIACRGGKKRQIEGYCHVPRGGQKTLPDVTMDGGSLSNIATEDKTCIDYVKKQLQRASVIFRQKLGLVYA